MLRTSIRVIPRGVWATPRAEVSIKTMKKEDRNPRTNVNLQNRSGFIVKNLARGRSYQLSRALIVIMRLRLLPALVKRPKVVSLILLSIVAVEKSGWLVAFAQSVRSSRLKRSVILNCFVMLASTSKKFGLVKKVCARSPSVPGRGFVTITPPGPSRANSVLCEAKDGASKPIFGSGIWVKPQK
jgi:hypothetical protein